MKGKKRCLIFAGGDCPKRPINTDDAFVIAADSGFLHTQQLRITPNLIIGDFDSYRGALPDGIPSVKLPPHKDITDTHAAVMEGIRAGCEEFELYGAIGSSPDHSFANLFLLLYLLNKGKTGIIFANACKILMIRNTRIDLTSAPGSRLSVFPFGGTAQGVCLKGVEYPLDEATLTCDFPLGVSNQFLDRQVTVEVKDGTLLLYCYFDNPKSPID